MHFFWNRETDPAHLPPRWTAGPIAVSFAPLSVHVQVAATLRGHGQGKHNIRPEENVLHVEQPGKQDWKLGKLDPPPLPPTLLLHGKATEVMPSPVRSSRKTGAQRAAGRSQDLARAPGNQASRCEPFCTAKPLRYDEQGHDGKPHRRMS